MSKIFSDKLNYRHYQSDYEKWCSENKKNKVSQPLSYEADLLRKKAKTLTEPILLFDKYEHEKAEDSETFFQTCNIELMSLTTLICSFPLLVPKLLPFLNKHADKSKLLKKTSGLIDKYNKKSLKILTGNVPLKKAMTVVSGALGAFVFVSGLKKSMQSQLGLIRKASFDASQNLINDDNLYAVYNEEQEREIDSIINCDDKTTSRLMNKLKDKVDINSAFKSVKEYNYNKAGYEKEKEEYFKTANGFQSEQDKKLLKNYLKVVEHDVLEPLRKVETISNISYSAMFTGGFLEYLISDKLVDVLHVHNKPLRGIMKFGVPLLTYFILNKNISDIENKAILATKYKHLKEFAENPESSGSDNVNEEKNLFKFIKGVYKDIKDYEKFTKEEMPKIEQRAEAKKQIKLSSEQKSDAKKLKHDTALVLNNQREKVYDETVGIKTISETLLGPLDIVATAIGAKIGNILSKKCPNRKFSGLLTGIGAVIAFIPAAIIEAKLTKQQKTAEKIAAMLAVKDIENSEKLSKEKINKEKTSSLFEEFNH